MFCPEELDEWLSLPIDRRRRGFFDCWTRKEAFVKALGCGLEVALDTFRVAFRPGETPAVRWRGDRREQWSMVDVSPTGAYSGALAVRRAAGSPQSWTVCWMGGTRSPQPYS
jgi:4'-phosphopantetheinyl transferase